MSSEDGPPTQDGRLHANEKAAKLRVTRVLVWTGVFLLGGAAFWVIDRVADPEIPGSSADAIGSTFSTSSTQSASTTPGSGAQILPGVTMEDLPTDLNDPEAWLAKIYQFFDSVYNTHSYEVLDFVYYGGLQGENGQSKKYDAEIARIQKTDDSTDDVVTVTGVLVPERTTVTNGGNVVGVEQQILFKDQEVHQIVDYIIEPKQVYFDMDGGRQGVTLYLINTVVIVCQFENGICQ